MLILASASPARSAMLEAAGVPVTADPARIDEGAVRTAMESEAAPPRDLADTLADLKACRVSARHPGALVLGADQVLVIEGEVLAKAATMEEAAEHLRMLRGRTHLLLSAAVIARDGAPIWRHVGQARLVMRPFSDAFLAEYLAGAGEDVLGSVGCYHLEGRGAQLFARVDGDYFTVLGLPLLEVLGFLRAQGVLTE